MSAENLTQRGFLPPAHPQSRDSLKVGRVPSNLNHGLNANGTSILYLPALLYGFMTELIKVDLSTNQVQCKFSIFVTIRINLNQNIMAVLRKKQLAGKREAEKKQYLNDELQKLTSFLRNNLIVECGDKIIDIISSEGKNQQIDQNQIETDSQEEESQDQQDCYWIKMPNLNQQNNVTYQIIGTFKSSFQLYNLYFPYHHINSTLCVKIREQYFNHMVLKYDLYGFQDITVVSMC